MENIKKRQDGKKKTTSNGVLKHFWQTLKDPRWLWIGLIVAVIVIVLLLISEGEFPNVTLSNGIVAFVSAVIGVLLTAFAISVQLKQQSDAEAQNEKEAKIYAEKLNGYQNFLKKLCEIVIQESNVLSMQDSKELVFKLAQLRMYIEKSDNVVDLFDGTTNILENLSNTQMDEDEKIPKLFNLIFSVTDILQRELNEEKEKELDMTELQKSIDNLSTIIVGRMENKEQVKSEEIPAEGIQDITKKFQGELEKMLIERLPKNGTYYFSQRIDNPTELIILKNKEAWGSDEFCIGLLYNENEKLHYYVHGADGNDIAYKALYLSMRRKWGGNYWREHWWRKVDEPYNGWVYTEEVRKIFDNLDNKMLENICNQFVEMVEYLTNFRKVIKLRDDVNKHTFKGLSIWANHERVLVHNYSVNENEKDDIVIDTWIENDQWRIYFFDRHYNPENTKDRFSKIIENLEVDKEHNRHATPFYNEAEIAEKLVEFRSRVEAEITEQNKQ